MLRKTRIVVRISNDEANLIKDIIKNNGFKNTSEYARFAMINSGRVAEKLYKIRKWLRDNDIIEK